MVTLSLAGLSGGAIARLPCVTNASADPLGEPMSRALNDPIEELRDNQTYRNRNEVHQPQRRSATEGEGYGD